MKKSLYTHFDPLHKQVEKYLPAKQIDSLKEAYFVAAEAHEGQKRSSGEPYITHPVAVAGILAEMHLDNETLTAALLHDVIEDTLVTYDEIETQFGKNIAELVNGVSKLDKLKFRDKKEAAVESFRKMIMAMVQDLRVILIKLADRTHNMRTLGSLRNDKRKRIARETLEIFTPLAHRLGIHNLKNELEELSFKTLYPVRYRILNQTLKSSRGNRNEIIQKILSEIKERLKQAGIEGSINGREKNIYSIYNKMRRKELRFHSILDIYAFRIIVKDVDTCYRVLGHMHGLYKPRSGRFKDYIAIPKANGYQSLHISLIGPRGLPVEIQVRTEDMDQMAEMGVAAHWSYKQAVTNMATHIRAQRWMQSLLELQQNSGNSFEFIESVKSDLFPDEIYVFTPRGRIIELPAGATPVDLAYAVHTDIGNTCVGARVDHDPFPLSQELRSGQTVEVIISPGSRPNAAWLNFVVSSKARSKIRNVLKNYRRQDSIQLGCRLLNHALGEEFNLENIPREKIEFILEKAKLASIDSLFAEIGLGNILSPMIAKALIEDNLDYRITVSNNRGSPHEGATSKLRINKSDGILQSFAKCCHPIPGDPIVAHIKPGKGLVIHRESCHNIRNYQKEPDKFVSLDWSSDLTQEFLTELKVQLLNHHGVLANLTSVINSANANIRSFNTEEKDGRVYNVFVLISVRDRKHLAEIMRKIRILPDIIKVTRNKN